MKSGPWEKGWVPSMVEDFLATDQAKREGGRDTDEVDAATVGWIEEHGELTRVLEGVGGLGLRRTTVIGHRGSKSMRKRNHCDVQEHVLERR